MILIGDLICYNTAGMTDKTLGLVVDVRKHLAGRDGLESQRAVLIQWCVVGKIMPRRSSKFNESLPGKYVWASEPPSPGDMAWYDNDKWFKVMK